MLTKTNENYDEFFNYMTFFWGGRGGGIGPGARTMHQLLRKPTVNQLKQGIDNL